MRTLSPLFPLTPVVLAVAIAVVPACSKKESPVDAGTEPGKEASTKEPADADDKKSDKKSDKKTDAKPEAAAPPKDPNLLSLFDGKKLGKWKAVEFGGEGEVFITEDGNLQFDFGALMTGVVWNEKAPPATSNYEIELEAMKLQGNDFFVGLTFPVKDSHASLIVGGWGGGIIGISSIDDLDASENETMNIEGFEDNRWYKIKIRVTDDKIEGWLDEKQYVDLELLEKKISVRPGDIELCIPLGLCSFQTRAQYRNITWRNLKPAGEGGTPPAK